MGYYIGIDLGTTGTRCIVYTNTFEISGECYKEYPVIYSGNGFIEQDANLWWSLTASTVREALALSGTSSGEVNAIAISSQGISIVPVDKHFNPLTNAISWLDARAKEETIEILNHYDQDFIYSHTGKLALASCTLPKLMWMRKYCPSIFSSAKYFLLPHDFLVSKLTGKPVTDHTMAAGTLLYDLKNKKWSQELSDAFGIDTEKLPRILWGGQPAGKLTKQAARELNLIEGIPVVAGGQDQKCAAYAAGLNENAATVSLGTAAAISKLCDTCSSKTISKFSYFLPDAILSEGAVETAGMALRWLRDTFFPQKSYLELDKLAQDSLGLGNLLFHPYLTGQEGSGTGANLSGLSLKTVPGEVVCAVMEGVAFEIRKILQAMDIMSITELRVFGGGAKSSIWPKIIASATGINVYTMNSPEMACLGAALLAACGIGERSISCPSPATTMAKIYPDESLSSVYEERFEIYESRCK